MEYFNWAAEVKSSAQPCPIAALRWDPVRPILEWAVWLKYTIKVPPPPDQLAKQIEGLEGKCAFKINNNNWPNFA